MVLEGNIMMIIINPLAEIFFIKRKVFLHYKTKHHHPPLKINIYLLMKNEFSFAWLKLVKYYSSHITTNNKHIFLTFFYICSLTLFNNLWQEI